VFFAIEEKKKDSCCYQTKIIVVLEEKEEKITPPSPNVTTYKYSNFFQYKTLVPYTYFFVFSCFSMSSSYCSVLKKKKTKGSF
jgi:hypothetical protein